jgi:triacylglycerol esterase/lipase EstA (alpha/beta hydrolase family)
MKQSLSLKEVHKAESALLDIVFIHGMRGEDTDTWTRGKDTYWPAMISACLPDASVYALNYSSVYLKNGDTVDSYEKALSILDYLTSNKIGTRPLAIICHSLGGIIAKMLMRK